MHEMSLAINIADLAQAKALEAGGGRIKTIELDIGALAGVMQESLEFCFEMAANDTLAAGASLCIHWSKGKGKCVACHAVLEIERFGSVCTECGNFLTILSGEDLRLLAIILEDEE